MWKKLRRALGRTSLFAAALVNVANPVLAQQAGPLPPAVAPPIIPADVRSAPVIEPILQVGAQEPAPRIPTPPGFNAPMPTPVPTAPAPNTGDDLKARIDRLEKQNQELVELLKTLQNRPAIAPTPTPVSTVVPSTALNKDDVQKLINEYLTSKESQDKAAGSAAKIAEENKGFVVGKSTSLSGIWTNHQPWFETADKAYRVHFGGRFQPDFVFGAGADDAVISGKGGSGAFREGFNFRRARLEADGWIHEVIDFFVEFDFVNNFSTGQPVSIVGGKAVVPGASEANTFNPVVPTDLWAGINYIPVIGGIRVGNLKPAIGLDHLTSSRYLDFMERSIGFDTYYNRDNGFQPGFMIFNYTQDERMSWQLTATKNNNGVFGWNVGGGDWNYCGRLTWLPWFEDNGRRMIHLGIGAKYASRLDQDRAILNDRWLLRNGPANIQNVVSQVQAFGTDQAIINPEFFMNLGPLSIQSEYIASQVSGVTSYTTQLTGSTAAKIPSTTFYSQTAYIQALYFLTGEHRPYGKTALHGSGAAPTRVVPYRNYFWVPGHGGNGNPFSAGAWQVGARYCYSDLNSGPINGGTVNEVTLGLNWFLNPNMKFQWNYDIGHRSLPGGTSDGNYWGFGMRMAFDF